MSKALPARANLAFLKKLCKERVKELRARKKPATLAAVQRAVAREHGFASWPKLRVAVEARAKAPVAEVAPTLAASFLDAAVAPADLSGGSAAAAREVLAKNPGLPASSIYAACAAGDVPALQRWLATDRSLAAKPGGARGWVPLLHICFSRLLKEEKSQRGRAAFASCAKLLLDAGADPNASFFNPAYKVSESALYGAAGIANDAGLTKLLLHAGAHVNDGESLYHASEFADHACLKLLLAKNPENISFCMCHKMDFEDPAGVKVFLEHGADPNFLIMQGAGDLLGLRPLHFAILRGRSPKVLQVLLDGGADMNLPTAAGLTPYAFARLLGNAKLAETLRKAGAEISLTARQEFFAACSAGDEKTARRLLAADPALLKELSPHGAVLLPQAAAAGNLKAVRLMLKLGFPIDAPGPWGGTALHQAAWAGRSGIVEVLLNHGARIDILQAFGGDALQTAIHGAVHGGHTRGPAIIRMISRRMKSAGWQKYLDMARKENTGPQIIAWLEALVGSTSEDPAIQSLPEHRRTHKIASWKPLMDAAFEGDAARIKKLLAAGADPNVISTTPARYRPLHRAIEFKKTTPRMPRHEDAVRALLDGGADPHIRGAWFRLTALGLAAIGETRFVELLRPRFEPLDIFHAAALGERDRVAALLKSDKSLARAADESRWTALHYAAHSAMHESRPELKEPFLDIARLLLASGADLAAAYLFDDQWPIPVLYGCCGWRDFPEMAELLIRAGANPCDHESVYHAADEGHAGALAVIERLTHKKALAAECSFSLPILLHWGHTRGMQWLLDHGADPNTLSEKWGNSALHEAAERGSSEKAIALLLKFGADPRQKNKAGKTAIDLAVANGHNRVAAQFKK